MFKLVGSMQIGRGKLLSILLATCSVFVAVLVYTEVQPRYTFQLAVNNSVINVELAQTPQALTHGLSNRSFLAADQGMLLDFGALRSAGIWMRHMNFPLDVIWFDEDLRIITISENVTPDTYPNVYYPTEPARYALEVNAGWVSANNISVGMTARLAGDAATTLY